MGQYRNFFLLCLLVLILILGCSTLLEHRIPSLLQRPEECQEFLNHLDEKVKEAGVRDASSYPVSGFPYLRTNRFLSSLKKNLKDHQEREQWVRWMQQLDLESRKKEIRNLPDELILSLASKKVSQMDREALFAHVEYCSCKIFNHDITRPDFYETLYPFVEVPDEYSFFRRAIGLYPFFSIPVIIATKKVRNEFKSWYKMGLDDLTIQGNLIVFAPSQEVFLYEEEVQELVQKSKENPLGVPWLNRNEERKIAACFAPIIIQDVAASYDNIGQVFWKGDRLAIDPEKPIVYYYITHALLKGKAILQINYVIWYSRRAGERSPWIERGRLDGLTVRVSLDIQGHPFMVDVMNNCGCYHFFVPKKERLDRVVSKSFRLDPFVPQWLPEITNGKHLGIRVNSGWHQVERLLAVEVSLDSILYELVPYEVLEALPREDGRTESMFNVKGLAKSSGKTKELLLFFSMGIPSIGSMRQRGHHAIALTGRVHFDNPRLFERNFVLK